MLIIKSGLVHDGLGGIKYCDIRVEGSKITGVGTGFDTEGATVIDAQGKEIFPGFVNALNIHGIMGPGWTGDDRSESSSPVTPEMDSTYAFDFDGMNFQRLYTYGVTASGVSPAAVNVIGGAASVFKTYGRSAGRMLVREKAVMTASVTKAVKNEFGKRNMLPMTRMGSFALLRGAIEAAIRYNPDNGYVAASEAMVPVVRGELPLVVNCATQSEIEAVKALLAPYGIRLILAGAYGLSRETVSNTENLDGVIMGNMTGECPPDGDSVFERMIPLMEESDNIAIGTWGDEAGVGREALLWNAILWYKNGLPAEKVLSAITSVPAKLLGVDDQIGSIKAGMDADFSIWTGNPIESYLAKPDKVFVSGEDVLSKEAYHSCW